MSRQIFDSSTSNDTKARQRWMGVLAKAGPAPLEAYWTALDDPPAYRMLRPAETGLVMVRGRIAGTGAPFNVGEMTMTRCALQLADGPTGFGHVAGRSRRHAELAALFDAMLQDPARHDAIERGLIGPLAAAQAARRAQRANEAAATKVEFLTMVRGE
ncbi:MAG TPA: phosphonate C-P lyase system protein PhnG [Aliidongia sp.]|nr:phosphonate C-P lyase system protein PhnG [Aliidongia sp.]